MTGFFAGLIRSLHVVALPACMVAFPAFMCFDPASSATQVTPVREGKKEERRKLDSFFTTPFEGTQSKKTLTAPEPDGFIEQSPRNFAGTAVEKSKKHRKCSKPIWR